MNFKKEKINIIPSRFVNGGYIVIPDGFKGTEKIRYTSVEAALDFEIKYHSSRNEITVGFSYQKPVK